MRPTTHIRRMRREPDHTRAHAAKIQTNTRKHERAVKLAARAA